MSAAGALNGTAVGVGQVRCSWRTRSRGEKWALQTNRHRRRMVLFEVLGASCRARSHSWQRCASCNGSLKKLMGDQDFCLLLQLGKAQQRPMFDRSSAAVSSCLHRVRLPVSGTLDAVVYYCPPPRVKKSPRFSPISKGTGQYRD